jgi:uncharacterized protein (TIGR00369 family)
MIRPEIDRQRIICDGRTTEVAAAGQAWWTEPERCQLGVTGGAVTEEHFRKLERMYASAPINEFFRPTLRVSEGRAEVGMAVRPELFHAAHAVHGSVYFKALDDASFFAVSSLVPEVFVLTVTFNVYLTRPISEGSLLAVARVVHRSRQLFVADAELFDDRSRQIGRGSGSFMRSGIALDGKVGYGG